MDNSNRSGYGPPQYPGAHGHGGHGGASFDQGDDEPTHIGGGYGGSPPHVVHADHSAPTMAGVSPYSHTPAPQSGGYQQPLPRNVPAAGMPAYEKPPDPYVGQTIAGRYHATRKLGEGGMGAVYLATHVTLEKQVALKILHSELARKADLVERFLQEAKAASRIRHEHVIDITDFGSTHDGAVFFAMEVLEGQDLHDVITRARHEHRTLPWPRLESIFLQVCAALAAAHGKGVIHRDLKPENIYLIERMGSKDFVKLLDFGIAKLTEVSEGDRKLTRTGMLFGTPEYMSPEQARGDSVDHRVDVYAMGCILYQLITGEVPFSGNNFMGVLSRHLADEPPLIPIARIQQVGAPGNINDVVQRALAKRPDERFQTIDALANAVRAASQGGAGPGLLAPSASANQMPSFGSTGPLPTPGGHPPVPQGGGRMVPTAPSANPGATGAVPPRPVEARAPEKKRSSLGLLLVLVVLLGAGGAAGFLLMGKKKSAEPDPGKATPKVATPSTSAQTPAGADQPVATPPTSGDGTQPTGVDKDKDGSATAKVEKVVVTLESTPAGAEVFDVEGAELGKTPLEHEMALSNEAHTFRLVLAGHIDKQVELVPDQSRGMQVELVPEPSRSRKDRSRKDRDRKDKDGKDKDGKDKDGKDKDGKDKDGKDKDDPTGDPKIKNPFANK